MGVGQYLCGNNFENKIKMDLQLEWLGGWVLGITVIYSLKVFHINGVFPLELQVDQGIT